MDARPRSRLRPGSGPLTVALDAALVDLYTGASDAEAWAGLILTHSLIAPVYLANAAEAQVGEVDGTPCTFQPVPFAYVLPSRDAEGRQDLRLHICALGGEVRAVLDAAIEAPDEPPLARFGEWLYGSTAARWSPLLELALTDVAVTRDGVQCTATRADVLNRTVPAVLYRAATYPGLDRR